MMNIESQLDVLQITNTYLPFTFFNDYTTVGTHNNTDPLTFSVFTFPSSSSRRKMRHKLYLLVLTTVTVFSMILCVFYRDKQEFIFGKTTERTTVPSAVVPPGKHVTKSLDQLGQMDAVNTHMLFLNHVPKCGAEILILLLEKLQGFNGYRHVRLKGGNRRQLSKLQQEEVVYEVYETARREAVPISFDRHVYFINFTSFDKQLPTYVNLVREPADKIVSRFSSKFDVVSYLNCLEKKSRGCTFKNGQPYSDFSIPYFCGHDQRCNLLNNDWAVQQAKTNVEKYYKVVGVLEELNATLEVLENKVPYFFKGVQKAYQTHEIYKFHQKYKQKKKYASDSVRRKLREILVKEYEFYEWIKSRLFGNLQMIYGDHHSH